MKSTFIATVSHELRTPLTSIKGSLSLIDYGVFGDLPDQVKSLVSIATRNSDRLINLVNDILDTEKLSSDMMVFDFQVLDLSHLVAEAVEANQGFAYAHGVTIRFERPVSGIRVLADSYRLTQVISNLISNAAKFSPDGGDVVIEVTARNDVVEVSVSDDGSGIPVQYHEQVFEQFTQVDSSDSREKRGTGLGLSIARSIIERHNGVMKLDVERRKGARFFFNLPISK